MPEMDEASGRMVPGADESAGQPVRATLAAMGGEVSGAAGGDQTAERGVARAYNDETCRTDVHGDLGIRVAQHLLYRVAPAVASRLRDSRLPERAAEQVHAAVLYVLCADADTGAVGVGDQRADAEEQGYDVDSVRTAARP